MSAKSIPPALILPHKVGGENKCDHASLLQCPIVDEIKSKGKTDISKIISDLVEAGECRCAETNPSGGCCLGNVYDAIKIILQKISGQK